MEKVRMYRSLYDPVSVLKGLMVFVHVWVYTHVITASRSGGFAMIKVWFIGRLPWSICVRAVRSGRKPRWMSLGLWWACSSYIAKMYMLDLVWFNLLVSFNHILPNSFIFCTSLLFFPFILLYRIYNCSSIDIFLLLNWSDLLYIDVGRSCFLLDF